MMNELTIKRTFDAPLELVFRAWTDPSLVSMWWGPQMFTVPHCELEPRKGGMLDIVMHGPKDSEYDFDMPMKGIFEEFDPPARLVFSSDAIYDENGVPQLSTICDVTFSDLGDKTEVSLYITLVKSTPASEAAWGGAETGWSESLDRLNATLASLQAAS